MKSQDILNTYLSLMKQHGHKEISNVSVIPENDPTLLYVNSGMFPLVPYLSGEKHPLGTRLTNVQRALRFFEDIDNVGNTIRHTTCFHMIGNWSLGDYFKEEQLSWIYEFFIEKIGLDVNRLYGTVFEGDQYAPRDDTSISIIQKVFKKYGIDAHIGERIFLCGREDNWWQRGNAPGELGGPDSEVFYYLGDDDATGKNPADDQNLFLEIGNSVFMQYKMNDKNGWEELPQKNVDFGGGLERIALVAQHKKDIYETDNFYPIIQTIERITEVSYHENPQITKAMRVLADHMRSSAILVMDGVTPSNKDQGYILRRLIRRMARYARIFSINEPLAPKLVDPVLDIFSWMYPDLKDQKNEIQTIIHDEEKRFHATLQRAEKEVARAIQKKKTEQELAQEAFNLFQSLGYPVEIFLDDLEQNKIPVNQNTFYKEYNTIFEKHKQTSRSGAEKKFKGGLADNSEQVVKYHTATHLIHQALCDLLGSDNIRQQGSNITGERLRFDFSSPTKPTDQQKKDIEDTVNAIIDKDLLVTYEVLPRNEAETIGAKSFFKEKYGEKIKVYFIGGDSSQPNEAYSKEFCGGPHVSRTKEIGHIEIFKIQKIGASTYRLYAR